MNFDFKASILIVDDAPDILNAMQALLQDRYQVRLAASGEAALLSMRQLPHPDLVVLDTAMPGLDGYAVCQELKSNFLTADIPVLFLVEGPEEIQGGFREGGADYLAKPLDAATVRARIDTHVRLRHADALLKNQHSHVETLVAERTRELVQMQDATILAMASLAETRDNDTGNHIRRTQNYVKALARELRFHSRFTAELTDENITLLCKSAPLHDIGKVAVPDAILLKPGRLTPEEFEAMKLHNVYGRDAILGVERSIGDSNNFLRYAREIAYSHHEKWDGSGYPEGLAGEAIPLAARLMAVADVYDALISKRVYKPAFTHETAVELIRQGRGEHFDPDVVDAMLVVEEKFRAISAEFQDRE